MIGPVVVVFAMAEMDLAADEGGKEESEEDEGKAVLVEEFFQMIFVRVLPEESFRF